MVYRNGMFVICKGCKKLDKIIISEKIKNIQIWNVWMETGMGKSLVNNEWNNFWMENSLLLMKR